MGDLGQLATSLSAIEDWLRQDCTARHNEDMADTVREAFNVIDDLSDGAPARNSGMALLAEYGYCPFCLSIQNYTSFVRATFKIGTHEVAPGHILTNPPELTKWLDEMMARPEWSAFTLDATTYAFIPVAIVKQTPVCTVHLWDITNPRGVIKL